MERKTKSTYLLNFNGNEIKENQCVFLDIETVPKYSSFDEFRKKEPDHFQNFNEFYKRREDFVDGLSMEDFYSEKAGLFPEYNKIICVSIGYIHKNDFKITTCAQEDEKELIEQVLFILNYLFENGCHFLVGANIELFDMTTILRKALSYNFMPPKILYHGMKPWEKKVIDIINIWRNFSKVGDAKFSTICYMMGVDSPKDDIAGKDVSIVYYGENNLPKIIDYCEKDVKALYDVFCKFQSLNEVIGSK